MAKVNRDNLVFEKNNRSCGDTASVWHYFRRSTDGLYAECQKCNKILKHSGSTSPLHNHLKLVHSINLKTVKGLQQTTKDNENTDLLTQNSESVCEPKHKKMKISDFFKADDDDVQTAVSKMAALDGLPFRVFSTSETLRKLFKKSGYDLPQSPNAIKNMVMAKCGQLKNDLKKEINELISKGHKFSITLDEWTSAKNRRYMNVNIHSPELKSKPFRNLGLSRIKCRGTSENCYIILKEKLIQFGLSLEDDIVCIVTDGASVMRALGQRTSAQSQLCLAHGIQCAVLDVLYKKDSSETGPSASSATIQPADPEDHNSDDSDTENEDDEEGFIMLPENTTNVPLIVYKDLINKVRQIVKYFKNSPTRTDLLNTHLDNDNKNLQVILDCKTRWSSLADMITRFLRLKDGIMKTLIDLKNDTKFSSSEFVILKDLSISLNVIKATVEAICREDANLLTAETALKFMISKLTERDSTISQQLVESLKARIIQRRKTELVSTLKYLHNPTKFYEERSCDVFRISYNIVPGFVVELLKKHLPTSPITTETTTDDYDDDVTLLNLQHQRASEESLSIKEQLSKEIEKSLSNTPSTSTAIPKQNEDLETLCRVQMALFDRGGPRSHHLSQIYDFLMTIPPTSVESERAFSSTGYLCNKLRTSLNDSTLDSLSFLRSYYQRLKK